MVRSSYEFKNSCIPISDALRRSSWTPWLVHLQLFQLHVSYCLMLQMNGSHVAQRTVKTVMGLGLMFTIPLMRNSPLSRWFIFWWYFLMIFWHYMSFWFWIFCLQIIDTSSHVCVVWHQNKIASISSVYMVFKIFCYIFFFTCLVGLALYLLITIDLQCYDTVGWILWPGARSVSLNLAYFS